MPRNPNKRRCQMPTCRSWARHGSPYCASHQPKPGVPPAPPPEAEPAALDDLSLLEAELLRLLEARAEFQAWVREQRAEGVEVNPQMVLKAIGDSSARMVQLIRARRELMPRDDALDELVEAIWQELQAGRSQEVHDG